MFRPRAGEPAARGLRRLRGHPPHRRRRRLDLTLDGAARPGHRRARLRRRVRPCGGGARRDRAARAAVDEIIVSTHRRERSGWLRRNVVDQIRRPPGAIPVEHVVVDVAREGGEENVLVVANETVLGEPLLDADPRARGASPASFLIVAPQSDRTAPPRGRAPAAPRARPAALRRDRRPRQVAHPDPYTAAMHAVRDERVDEIIVSTFPGERSGWLRRDLVERLARTRACRSSTSSTEAARWRL